MQEAFEKIIEKLEELKQKEKNRPDDCDENGIGDGEQTVEIIKIVKQAAAEYNNGWIQVSERLPDSSCDVIITTRSLVNGVDSYFVKDREWIQWYSGGGIAVDVIAWKPLPEPYRPCNNDKCAYYSGKDCPASEGCGGYEEPEWKNHLMNRFMKGE